MNQKECNHQWTITNVRDGYLVVEGCFHCGNRVSYFSEEPVPPIEDYREGDHFWGYLGSFQATKFDLKCKLCGKYVNLNDVMALMLCTECDPNCEACKLSKEEGGIRTWVYVALCSDSSHTKGKCINEESIKALTEYFNQGIKAENKKIIVVPCIKRSSPDKCEGIVLADMGLTEIY